MKNNLTVVEGTWIIITDKALPDGLPKVRKGVVRSIISGERDRGKSHIFLDILPPDDPAGKGLEVIGTRVRKGEANLQITNEYELHGIPMVRTYSLP